MPKHILFLLDFYPTEDNHACVFAKNLICEMADKGIKCTVIAPQALTPGSVRAKYPPARRERTKRGQEIEIYMPYYAYASYRPGLIRVSMMNHYLAAMGVIKKYRIAPDAVYGHFLFQCGLTASRVGKALGIPSFYACGENSTRLMRGSEPYATGLKHGWPELVKGLSGIIAVSSYNKQLLRENGFADESARIGVFPNGVDTDVFRPADKRAAREALGLPRDAFIAIFNGDFSERKGFRETCEALRACPGVSSVFLGSDSVRPDCPGVLFSGKVKPESVPRYLAAADVFVLPTKGEGCCNAIVEALAMGLPVISSDRPFNQDILNDENSIRIDPDDARDIARAICLVRDGGFRGQEDSRELSLSARADKILRFMDGK